MAVTAAGRPTLRTTRTHITIVCPCGEDYATVRNSEWAGSREEMHAGRRMECKHVTVSASAPVEACEGGCGAKVFTARPAERRPEPREVVKGGSVEHTADRCRALRSKLAEKAP